jgi:hypothetical protein
MPRRLQRAGQWHDALAALPPGDASPLRADILADRFWWRHEGAPEAQAAVDELSDTAFAALLGAQLAYTRLLFGLDGGPDDREVARRGFTTALGDDRLRGWAHFWLGVYADNVEEDHAAAAGRYAAALDSATDAADGTPGDPLLESYAVRHQGFHAFDEPAKAIPLLRRSLYLRAALGARPAVATAAVALAEALREDAEADTLRQIADLTARELGIAWLLAELSG